jgi:hypothetical protein
VQKASGIGQHIAHQFAATEPSKKKAAPKKHTAAEKKAAPKKK